MKNEKWNNKKEKVGQMCPETKTGAAESWAMVEINRRIQVIDYILLINQPINQSLWH